MPSITWRTKCGFGHKHLTWHGLKWFTGGIRFSFIIAGDDPDFSVPFNAYLGRSQNMSGGMEGNLNAAKLDFFPVIDAMGVGFSVGRASIATKMRYAFGILRQGFQRRRIPDAMPQRQHTS